jgi:hypothetical protein
MMPRQASHTAPPCVGGACLEPAQGRQSFYLFSQAVSREEYAAKPLVP